MKRSIELVAEFHEVFNHPVALVPTLPDAATVDFRVKFIKEELQELEDAVKNGDIVGVADALTDIQYVLDGFYLNCGLHNHKDELLEEVHASNLSKTCSSEQEASDTMLDVMEKLGSDSYMEPVGEFFIVKRVGDGKVMKSINYFKPRLKGIIENVFK